jgi:hypothetical protein
MTVAPTHISTPREHHRLRLLLVAIGAFLAGIGVAVVFQLDGADGTSSVLDGSGVAATETRGVAPFTTVELAGNNNVVIRAGEEQSVVVKADDNLLGTVTTEVEAGHLVIGNSSESFTTNSPMTVEVSVPTLEALTLTGNGNLVVDGIAAQSLLVNLSGNGTITASGSAARLDATVSGVGQAQLARISAEDVQAVVSGSGALFVTATQSLDAFVPGSGTIVYMANPQDVTRNVTGTGSIVGR